MIYGYKARDGQEIEVDRPIGTAPKCVRRGGKLFRRVYTVGAPICNDFVMGRKPSKSSQLPRYYGHLDYNAVWSRRLNGMGLPNTPETRRFARDKGLAPGAKAFLAEGKRNAERAGRLDKFDKVGRPMAGTLKTVQEHIGRGADLGDSISWEK